MPTTQSSPLSIGSVLARIRTLSQRRARDAQRCFWLEGVRQFVQAYDAHMVIDAVIVSPILLKSDLCEMLVRRLGAAGVPRIKATPEQFRQVSSAERASGIGAIVRQRWTPLAELSGASIACFLVMEEIRSPGNLGSILRTAEACGVSGVIFIGGRCDPFDAAVVRAAMGGLFHLPLVRTNAEALAAWALKKGVLLVGLSPKASRLWTQVPRERSLAIVLGEERKGLSPLLDVLCSLHVRLPMAGRADSLNVSVAAGVMMYEMVRTAPNAAT